MPHVTDRMLSLASCARRSVQSWPARMCSSLTSLQLLRLDRQPLAFKIAATHMMPSGSTGMRGTTSPCHSYSAADHVAKRDWLGAHRRSGQLVPHIIGQRTSGEHTLCWCATFRTRSRFQDLGDSFCWRRGRRCCHAIAAKS